MQLWEREGELAAVDAAIGGALSGEGSVLALEGPAGIGKTQVVQAAQARAADRGMRVLSARGGELERDFPNGVVRQLVERPLLTAPPDARDQILGGPAAPAARALGLAGGGAADAASAAADQEFAVIHGLYWLVANLSEEQPLMLSVDDAHWADQPSLRFLAYLAPRVRELPVLLLVAARTGEATESTPVLAQLLDDPAAVRLLPRPLSPEATASLLRTRLGAEPDASFAETCHAVTHGNPFLLRQLAEAVEHDGLPPTAEGAGRVRGLGPRTVARAILLRLSRLPQEAAALARAVAVLGAEVSLLDAGALAHLDAAATAQAADLLRGIDVLAPGEPLSFVHPIVRSAIYADLPESERAAWHGRAAAVLRDRGAGAVALGPHLLATLPAGDPAAAAALVDAGRQARREGATAISVRFFARALAEPPPPDQAASVLADLGTAEVAAGDPAGAADHLAAAVEETADPVERARLALPYARAVAARDGHEASAAVLVAAIEQVEGVDRDLALRLESELAALGGQRDRYTPGLAERLARHSELPGRSAAECLILASHAGTAAMTGGRADESVAIARRALNDDILLREEGPECVPFYHAVVVLTICDDVATARAALDEAFLTARASGSAYGFAAASLAAGFLEWRLGNVVAAERESGAAMDVLGEHPAYGPMLVGNQVLAMVERGHLDEAEGLLTAFGWLAAPPDAVPAIRVLLGRSALRLARNRPEDALADALESGGREQRWGLRDYELGWRTYAALAHRRLDATDEAQRLAVEHLELSRGFGAKTPLGRALRFAGLVEDGGDAIALLQEAVDVLEAAPGRLEHAHALVAFGAALRRAGRRSAARDPLRAGMDAARACGAAALVEAAHAELTAAGARPRKLMFSGVESLTASERRVAELAAGGLGNREIAAELFVTVKTVENHLSRVYNKLDIRSRAQLAGALGGEPEAQMV